MRRQLAAFLVGAALVATTGAVVAHHSFAMFDQQNPIEVVGTVKEFRYTSPHVYISFGIWKADRRASWSVTDGRARASSPATSCA